MASTPSKSRMGSYLQSSRIPQIDPLTPSTATDNPPQHTSHQPTQPSSNPQQPQRQGSKFQQMKEKQRNAEQTQQHHELASKDPSSTSLPSNLKQVSQNTSNNQTNVVPQPISDVSLSNVIDRLRSLITLPPNMHSPRSAQHNQQPTQNNSAISSYTPLLVHLLHHQQSQHFSHTPLFIKYSDIISEFDSLTNIFASKRAEYLQHLALLEDIERKNEEKQKLLELERGLRASRRASRKSRLLAEHREKAARNSSSEITPQPEYSGMDPEVSAMLKHAIESGATTTPAAIRVTFDGEDDVLEPYGQNKQHNAQFEEILDNTKFSKNHRVSPHLLQHNSHATPVLDPISDKRKEIAATPSRNDLFDENSSDDELYLPTEEDQQIMHEIVEIKQNIEKYEQIDEFIEKIQKQDVFSLFSLFSTSPDDVQKNMDLLHAMPQDAQDMILKGIGLGLDSAQNRSEDDPNVTTQSLFSMLLEPFTLPFEDDGDVLTEDQVVSNPDEIHLDTETYTQSKQPHKSQQFGSLSSNQASTLIERLFTLRQALCHVSAEKLLLISLIQQQQHRLGHYQRYIGELKESLKQTFDQRLLFEFELQKHKFQHDLGQFGPGGGFGLNDGLSESTIFSQSQKPPLNQKNNQMAAPAVAQGSFPQSLSTTQLSHTTSNNSNVHQPNQHPPHESSNEPVLPWFQWNDFKRPSADLFNTAQNNIFALIAQVNQQQSSFKFLQHHMSNQLSTYRTKLTTYQDKYKSSMYQLQHIEGINTALQNNVIYWKNSYSDLFSSVDSIITEAEEEKLKNARLANTISVLQSKLHSQTDQIQSLQDEICELKAALHNGGASSGSYGKQSTPTKTSKASQPLRQRPALSLHDHETDGVDTFSELLEHVDHEEQYEGDGQIGHEVSDEVEAGELPQLDYDHSQTVVTHLSFEVECCHCAGVVDINTPVKFGDLYNIDPHLLHQTLCDLEYKLPPSSKLLQTFSLLTGPHLASNFNFGVSSGDHQTPGFSQNMSLLSLLLPNNTIGFKLPILFAATPPTQTNAQNQLLGTTPFTHLNNINVLSLFDSDLGQVDPNHQANIGGKVPLTPISASMQLLVSFDNDSTINWSQSQTYGDNPPGQLVDAFLYQQMQLYSIQQQLQYVLIKEQHIGTENARDDTEFVDIVDDQFASNFDQDNGKYLGFDANCSDGDDLQDDVEAGEWYLDGQTIDYKSTYLQQTIQQSLISQQKQLLWDGLLYLVQHYSLLTAKYADIIANSTFSSEKRKEMILRTISAPHLTSRGYVARYTIPLTLCNRYTVFEGGHATPAPGLEHRQPEDDHWDVNDIDEFHERAKNHSRNQSEAVPSSLQHPAPVLLDRVDSSLDAKFPFHQSDNASPRGSFNSFDQFNDNDQTESGQEEDITYAISQVPCLLSIFTQTTPSRSTTGLHDIPYHTPQSSFLLSSSSNLGSFPNNTLLTPNSPHYNPFVHLNDPDLNALLTQITPLPSNSLFGPSSALPELISTLQTQNNVHTIIALVDLSTGHRLDLSVSNLAVTPDLTLPLQVLTTLSNTTSSPVAGHGDSLSLNNGNGVFAFEEDFLYSTQPNSHLSGYAEGVNADLSAQYSDKASKLKKQYQNDPLLHYQQTTAQQDYTRTHSIHTKANIHSGEDGTSCNNDQGNSMMKSQKQQIEHSIQTRHQQTRCQFELKINNVFTILTDLVKRSIIPIWLVPFFSDSTSKLSAVYQFPTPSPPTSTSSTINISSSDSSQPNPSTTTPPVPSSLRPFFAPSVTIPLFSPSHQSYLHLFHPSKTIFATPTPSPFSSSSKRSQSQNSPSSQLTLAAIQNTDQSQFSAINSKQLIINHVFGNKLTLQCATPSQKDELCMILQVLQQFAQIQHQQHQSLNSHSSTAAQQFGTPNKRK